METWKIITNVILKHRWKRLQGAYKHTAQGVSNVNFAIKREQSQTGLSYADQKQNRRSQCTIERGQSQAIRTMSDEQGNPLFCGKDVCDALQHTNSRRAIAKLVDEGDVTKRYTTTSSGEQQMTFINESGLYSLILSSKLLNKNTLREKRCKAM